MLRPLLDVRPLLAVCVLAGFVAACSTPPKKAPTAPPSLDFRIVAEPGEDGPGLEMHAWEGGELALLPGRRFLIDDASVVDIGSGRTGVRFSVYAEQRDDFRIWTGQHVGKRVAIVHDGELLSVTPLVIALPGEAVISGGRRGLSPVEADDLARSLSRRR